MKKITVAVCTDPRGGMMFNNRRQVKDQEIVTNAVEYFGKCGVFVTQYSARLFEKYENVTVCDDPIRECADGGLCFIEDPDLLSDCAELETLVIYTWGIPYPADKYLPFEPAAFGLKRISKEKLSTQIHKKVTREVFLRDMRE